MFVAKLGKLSLVTTSSIKAKDSPSDLRLIAE